MDVGSVCFAHTSPRIIPTSQSLALFVTIFLLARKKKMGAASGHLFLVLRCTPPDP